MALSLTSPPPTGAQHTKRRLWLATHPPPAGTGATAAAAAAGTGYQDEPALM